MLSFLGSGPTVGLRVSGFGLRVQGLEFKASGFYSRSQKVEAPVPSSSLGKAYGILALLVFITVLRCAIGIFPYRVWGLRVVRFGLRAP